jgi:predicted transposase YbfD/YdcC
MIDVNSIEIIPSVLTHNECNLLNKWVLDNHNTNIFQRGRVANNRKTTRFTNDIKYDYPDLIVNTFKKIKEKYNFLENENIPQGNGGIICAISFNGSKLEKHIDPKYEDTESLHFIIKTSSGDNGGDLIINDVIYKINEGDCLYFFASVHPHETNILNCDTHRIVWINGIKVKL